MNFERVNVYKADFDTCNRPHIATRSKGLLSRSEWYNPVEWTRRPLVTLASLHRPKNMIGWANMLPGWWFCWKISTHILSVHELCTGYFIYPHGLWDKTSKTHVHRGKSCADILIFFQLVFRIVDIYSPGKWSKSTPKLIWAWSFVRWLKEFNIWDMCGLRSTYISTLCIRNRKFRMDICRCPLWRWCTSWKGTLPIILYAVFWVHSVQCRRQFRPQPRMAISRSSLPCTIFWWCSSWHACTSNCNRSMQAETLPFFPSSTCRNKSRKSLPLLLKSGETPSNVRVGWDNCIIRAFFIGV